MARFGGPFWGQFWDLFRDLHVKARINMSMHVDLHVKTRVNLHMHADLYVKRRVLDDRVSIWGSILGPILGSFWRYIRKNTCKYACLH